MLGTETAEWVFNHASIQAPTDSTPINRKPHLEAIIGPAAKLHDASLLVEWEVLNVHLARGVVNGRGPPLHQAGVEQRCLRGQGHFEVAVGTADKVRNRKL